MATKIVLKNPTVKIDDSAGTPVDLTAQVEGLTITAGANTDTTNASGDDTEINTATLKTWSASVTVFQEFGAGNVDDVIFNGLGNVVTFFGTPNGATVSATNPSYSGEAIVTSFNPVDGSHGDVLRATIELAAASALVRATA